MENEETHFSEKYSQLSLYIPRFLTKGQIARCRLHCEPWRLPSRKEERTPLLTSDTDFFLVWFRRLSRYCDADLWVGRCNGSHDAPCCTWSIFSTSKYLIRDKKSRAFHRWKHLYINSSFNRNCFTLAFRTAQISRLKIAYLALFGEAAIPERKDCV